MILERKMIMGICGIPWWATDIGGFSGGDPEDEDFRKLLVRWFQYGTFSPVMRLHGDRKPVTRLFGKDGRSALFIGSDNEVWSFGEEVYNILVNYMNLREAMRHYTRELMKQAHEMGTPVIRTMFYEFPEDKLCWELKDQYMYASDILIVPVLYKDLTSMEVYQPANAEWTNIHDGKTYSGGQTIAVKAPLEVIPVFVRDNRQSDLIGKI